MSQSKRALLPWVLLLLGAGASHAAPLAFEPNLGQTDAEVAFFSRTSDGVLFLTPSEIVLRLTEKLSPAAEPSPGRIAPPPARPRQYVLRIQPVGASAPRLESGQPLDSRSSYYRAAAAAIPEVPHFGRVVYRGIYPLTDLVVRGEDGRWAYDFVLAPGADPARIALRFAGGSGGPAIEADGSLRLDTPLGPVHQSAPFLFQEIGGEKVAVAGGFELRPDGLVGFKVGSYDRARPLVIDPTFSYKTCVGGLNGYSSANGVEVTPNGQAYIVGTTWATDFPRPGGAQGDGPGSDAFVAKLDLAGNLSRATYFHLLGNETGESIDLDGSNNVIVSGSTADLGYLDTQAWVAKLPPLLDFVNWTRTFGGAGNDLAFDVAFDNSGNVFAGGATSSANFCGVGPFAGKCTLKSVLGGESDAFVAKLGPNGGAMWATLAGNNNFDRGTSVAVDDSGRPYLAGYSHNGATPEVYSSWVRRFAAAGTSIQYSFPFGAAPSPGPGQSLTFTAVWDLAVDLQNNAFVTGSTNSAVLEMVSAVQPWHGGGVDAFVGMINNSGSGFVYNTYLGGATTESGEGIRVYNGHAYVAGRRHDTDYYGDAFVARYSSGGLGLVFYTAFGGNSFDYAYALAQDSSRNLYVAGFTASSNFDPGDAACGQAATTDQAFVVKVLP